MAEMYINKDQQEEQLVIDRQYRLLETSKATEIITKALDLAREEIPKGKVATYIPELGKADPHQLGIVLNPLIGDKICLGDYDVRFTMQSVCKVLMLIVSLEICGRKAVFKKVGMEPSGEAFDSLVELDVNDSTDSQSTGIDQRIVRFGIIHIQFNQRVKRFT
jgi:glutaminase